MRWSGGSAAELMGRQNVIVINDEAHHCYRHKVGEEEDRRSPRRRAGGGQKNEEAARVWISGLEVIKRKLGVRAVYDLSATPFFLRGSGYEEGKLFPWVVSDFGLMDAIECGIVKVPRVPVPDDPVGGELPDVPRPLQVIRDDLPKNGRGKAGEPRPEQAAGPAAERAGRALQPL